MLSGFTDLGTRLMEDDLALHQEHVHCSGVKKGRLAMAASAWCGVRVRPCTATPLNDWLAKR